MNKPVKRLPRQLVKSTELPTGRGATAVVAIVVALALAALRCSVDVPLGVDPRSDAAGSNVDAGAGN